MASDKETFFKYERRDCLRAVGLMVVCVVACCGVVDGEFILAVQIF